MWKSPRKKTVVNAEAVGIVSARVDLAAENPEVSETANRLSEEVIVVHPVEVSEETPATENQKAVQEAAIAEAEVLIAVLPVADVNSVQAATNN